MKKIALTSLLAAFAVSAANADTNYFIGGGIGFQTQKNHEDSSFSVLPEFGWKYSSNWDFGLGLNFYHDHDTDLGWEDKYSYGANIFARYKVAEFGDFKILVRGDIGAEMYKAHPAEGDSETAYALGASIMPMITYDVSESFTLYAKLNFLGLDVYYGEDYNDNKIWRIEGFGDTGDLANTDNFQIGFYYNF